MKSRKTPQQKLIFQIGSLNSKSVNEVFFHLTILFLFISLPGFLYSRSFFFLYINHLQFTIPPFLDEGLMLKTSASEALQTGQFTLPTQLIIVKYRMRLTMIIL